MNNRRISLVIWFLLMNFMTLLCQDKPVVDLSLVSHENIEYAALKSLFFLVRQEYVMIARDGQKVTRGGNEFFGKAYTIGVLTEDLRLLFPKSIIYPWRTDANFTDYQRGYRPECTYTRFRGIEEPSYVSNDTLFQRKFIITGFIDTNQVVVHYVFGQKGIIIGDSLPGKGSVIIFHTANPLLEKAEYVQYSIINVENAKWNSEGYYMLRVPYLGNQQILGGAFFQRIISLARIEWVLSGILVPVNKTWAVKSILPDE